MGLLGGGEKFLEYPSGKGNDGARVATLRICVVPWYANEPCCIPPAPFLSSLVQV